jgi:hypothetical protein
MDSHPVLPEKVEGSLPDGRMQLYDESFPGQIPFRSLLPPNFDNLLVPVCVSSTHVAWQAIRLEATWMHIAESAAIAAALAIQRRQSPADLDTEQLLRILAAKRVMLAFFNDVNVAGSESWVPAAQYFATRGFFPDYDARAGEALAPPVARLWAESLQQLHAKKLAPRALAARLARLSGDVRGTVSAEDFARMISGRKDGFGAATARPVTRGEALLMMWERLDR